MEMASKSEILGNSRAVLVWLDQLHRHQTSLHTFIQRLKAYRRFMNEACPDAPDWNHDIFELWATLEITYAIAAADDRTSLTPVEMQRVEEACKKVRTMIEQRISELRDDG